MRFHPFFIFTQSYQVHQMEDMFRHVIHIEKTREKKKNIYVCVYICLKKNGYMNAYHVQKGNKTSELVL